MSLVDVAIGVWERKLTVIIAGAVVLGLAILYLNIATYTYTAQLKVASVDSIESQRGGGALSSLAAVAGVGFRSSLSDPQFELYIEGLTSVETAKALEDNTVIMHTVFDSMWDESTKSWREPPGGIKKDVIGVIKSGLGIRSFEWQPPNAIRLSNYLSKNLQISRSKDTIITVISFTHEDPEFAKYFIKTLNDTVDDKLRQRAILRSSASIHYLKEQLEVVQVSEYRQALLQALSEQERIRMIASSGLPFAADVISGPEASEYPDKPRASITLALAILLGGILGLLIAFTRYAIADAKLRRNRASSADWDIQDA